MNKAAYWGGVPHLKLNKESSLASRTVSFLQTQIQSITLSDWTPGPITDRPAPLWKREMRSNVASEASSTTWTQREKGSGCQNRAGSFWKGYQSPAGPPQDRKKVWGMGEKGVGASDKGTLVNLFPERFASKVAKQQNSAYTSLR